MKTLFVSVILSLSLLMSTNLFAKLALPKPSILQEVYDLQALGELSKEQKLPILLMFGAEWCDYCQLLKEEVIVPMVASGLYDGKVVLIRHVGVDEPDPILHWNDQKLKKSKWAYQINADITPTIIFFDGTGKEIAPRIIGISEITLYAQLIHQSLNTAYKNMRLSKQIPATPELLQIQTNQAK